MFNLSHNTTKHTTEEPIVLNSDSIITLWSVRIALESRLWIVPFRNCSCCSVHPQFFSVKQFVSLLKGFLGRIRVYQQDVEETYRMLSKLHLVCRLWQKSDQLLASTCPLLVDKVGLSWKHQLGTLPERRTHCAVFESVSTRVLGLLPRLTLHELLRYDHTDEI